MTSGETSSHMLGSPRRLAAIVCADIAGYSRLMGRDEEGTHARIKRHRREIIEPTVAEHYGRIIKNTGDGFLAIFDSPLEAVRCAIVIQQSMSARNVALPRQQWVQYRIGVNLGDVIVDPEDIYGEGVNIAARLENLAEPGSVYISGGVYEQVKNKLVCGYQSLGDEKLKNITDPVRIYRVLPDPAAVTRFTRTRHLGAGLAAGVLVAAAAAGWYRWQFATERNADMDLHAGAVQTMGPSWSAPVPTPAPTPPQAPVQERAQAPVQAPAQAAAAPGPPASGEPLRTAALPGMPPAPPVVGEAPIPMPPQPSSAVPQAAPATSPSRRESPPQPAAAAAAPPADASKADPLQVAALSVQRAPDRPAATAPTVQDCPQCPEMITVQGGSFMMGSSDDPSERPVHPVTVEPFALGRFPVTVGEWKVCVAAKACSYDPDGDADLPVHNISFADAQQYVDWLAKISGQPYRLPTEAEWEYAARAGTTTRYWWGNQLVAGMANCKGCGGAYDPQQPQRVGSFPPNAFGLHDMTGGVAQWVADCWFRDYHGAPRSGVVRNLRNCREHVLRGGSWRHDPSYVSVSSRIQYDSNVRYIAHGVRVARSLQRGG